MSRMFATLCAVAVLFPASAAAHYPHSDQPLGKMRAPALVRHWRLVVAHDAWVCAHGRGRPKRSHCASRKWAWRNLEAAEMRLPPKLAICAVFGPYCGQALAVSYCETGGTYWPGATNGQYVNIFQMGYSERRTYGWHIAGSPPYVAAKAAWRYFVASGRDWSPWSCKP